MASCPLMESLTFEKESTTSELFIATKEGFTPYKVTKMCEYFRQESQESHHTNKVDL